MSKGKFQFHPKYSPVLFGHHFWAVILPVAATNQDIIFMCFIKEVVLDDTFKSMDIYLLYVVLLYTIIYKKIQIEHIMSGEG